MLFRSMSRVNFHDQVLDLLPGHPGAGAPARRLTDYDKKHLLYDGVPGDYSYSFRKASLVLATIALNDLIKYMEELYAMDDTAQRALRAGSSTLSNSNPRMLGRSNQPSTGSRFGYMSSRPGFRGYSGPGRNGPHGGRGFGYSGGGYGRFPPRPPYFQPSGNNNSNTYNNYQGNRGNAMTPRRIGFDGGQGRGSPRGPVGNYSPGRGAESHYNSRARTVPSRDNYYAGGVQRGSGRPSGYRSRQGPRGGVSRNYRSSYYNESEDAQASAGDQEDEADVLDDYQPEFDPNEDGYFGDDVDVARPVLPEWVS